ncbi:MAG: M20/M25/M40 family metallo-hydrolase, partial [Sphingomonadaceae bacterium]|nr:M20/M25/M40 family metallo-hydrolase [Sphingomonadaceae bacterium]
MTLCRLLACAALVAALPADAQQTEPPVEASEPHVTEIAVIRADPAVVRAFATIESGHAAANRDLVTLNQIPAPPFGEQARGAAFAEMLRASGVGEVSIDEVGNVIARRPGTGARTVMIAAHLDTVFPAETDVTVRIEGDRYTAPGIGDNTRGLVMLLELARAIAAAEIATNATILFVGNVGEEGPGDLRGVRHIFRQGADHPEAFIAIDGGEENRLVSGGVGSNRYRVTFRGPGGHSWGAFGTANPHHAAARAIALFDERALSVTREGPRSSYNIGRIGGGTSVNSIPFESWFEVDMRSGDPARIAALDAVFQAAMQEGLAAENADLSEGAPLTVEIEDMGRRPAGPGDAEDALVQR